METGTSPLAEGTLVGGRYQVQRSLGRGGMGAVYAATDTRLGTTVALKQLHRSEAQLLPAFEREARLLAGLRHPALPTVSDYFADEMGRFLVMQYIPGDDLLAALTSRGAPFEPPAVLGWADELLDVLIYLHGHSPPIIHRDIKPLNLKLTPSGEIYLLDFGLAKGTINDQASTAGMPSLYGYSARYSPPEQIEYRGTDPRSDLYALAATLYHVLAATPPELSVARYRVISEGRPDPLRPLSELNPTVPDEVSQLIAQALALDPDRRPASAASMRMMLRDAGRADGQGAAVTVVLPDQEQEPPVSVEAQAVPTSPLPDLEARTVWYDTAERRRTLHDMLSSFIEAIKTERIRDALGRDALVRVREQERQVRERLDAPFTLVVMGDFKRGKSTLVNALLGAEVATMNVTPETLTINRIGYGPELRVEAHLADGGRLRLRPDELHAEKLEPLLKQLPHSVSYLQIEAPLDLLRGLTLVDMPGTGDTGWRFDQQVQAYLPYADAIIYVVSALAPLSASEQAFLRLAVAPQEFPKLIFVANMVDSLRNERDVDRVLGLLRQRINALFPNATVFGVSALDELCRVLGRSRSSRRAAALGTAFATFRAALDESILLNRDIIQIDRAIVQFGALLEGFADSTTRLLQAVERDQVQLSAAIAEREDQSSALHRAIGEDRAQARAAILAYGEQAAAWMYAFVDRLDRDLVARLPQYPLADVQRHLHFFLSDALSTALRHCIDTHQPQIVAVLERARAAIQNQLGEPAALNVAPGVPSLSHVAASATFNPSLWNNLDTLRLVATYAQTHLFDSVGQIMLQGVLSVIDRQIDDPRQLISYQTRLRNALPELRAALAREVTTLYTGIADQIDGLIEQAYQSYVATSVSSMRQAHAIHREGEQRVAAVKEVCLKALAVVADAREQLAAFQERLWPANMSDH
jgi:serine/threonine protein kinase